MKHIGLIAIAVIIGFICAIAAKGLGASDIMVGYTNGYVSGIIIVGGNWYFYFEKQKGKP